MITNLSLRIYTYRLVELVQDPRTLNTITNNNFTAADWSNPVYNNYVQLLLWSIFIVATMIFHTVIRVKFFAVHYYSPALGFMIVLKALLLLFDMVASSLFLYTFLVSLGGDLFGASPDIPLMLSIMITSPFISTACNSFINLPLLYLFDRLQKKSAFEVLKNVLKRLFSPLATLLYISVLYYVAVTAYLLARLNLITLDGKQLANFVGLVVVWSPQRIVVALTVTNLAVNYLVGILFLILYWMGRALSCWFM